MICAAGAYFRGGAESVPRGVLASVVENRCITNWSFERRPTVCTARQSKSMPGPSLRAGLSANSPIPAQAAAAKAEANHRNDRRTGAWNLSGNSGLLSLARSRTNLVTAFPRQGCRLARPKEQRRYDRCSAVDRQIAEAEDHASVGFDSLAESSPAQDLTGGRDIFSEELGDNANPSGNGKTGFVSFYHSTALRREATETGNIAEIPRLTKDWKSLLWILGPVTLVTSVVVPPLYLRTVSEALLQDSLLTDFVILFFTESCFYAGALVFLYLADKFSTSLEHGGASESIVRATAIDYYPLGYQVSTKISLALGLLLPVVTLVVVWSWTGPAAAAALLPYILGLVVQLSFEQIARSRNSSVWPVVPVIFQVYRLHQLNRAAQLVAGLLFSLRGAETTAETLAINGALRTLLSVLQLLGILALWSLSSFLSHGFVFWTKGRTTETPA